MRRGVYRDSVLSVAHDGVGWCIMSQRRGEAPFYLGCYAADAPTAHWAAREVASVRGCTVEPLRLN
jgi:hypothetical protein